MNIYPLVFSNDQKYRISRHVLFWLVWIAYYTIFMTFSWVGKFPLYNSLMESFVEETLPIPLDIIFCYAVIYFLIPHFLFKGRYILIVVLWLAFGVLHILCFQFYSTHYIPLIRAHYQLPYMVSTESFMFTFFFIFTQINMEASLAAAIKLGKMWYIKQQELNIIKGEKQKLAAVDSGKIQPVFLVNALDKIVDLSVRNPYIIPQMISKIKPLLLYMIYDINQPKVDLKKELHLMEDFVELEKVGIEGMEVRINISGNADHEMIAPFLILPLVENCFRQLSRSGIRDKYINLEATTEEGVFSLWIKWNKPVDSSTLINNDNTFFKNIGKRLKLLYPQSHELKIFIEAIEFRVHMKIDLNRSILNV